MKSTHSHAFNREHSTKMLKFKLEATSISSTVHVRQHQRVSRDLIMLAADITDFYYVYLQYFDTVGWVFWPVTRSQAVARIADRTAKNCRGHVTYATPTFRVFYLCACSALPIQSRVSNLKSLAQAVFEILRSKRIGVMSLAFQGHVTSSVTWPFDSPYAISYW